MLEKELERRLKNEIEKIPGALCLKFVSPGYSGVPDRIVLLPGGLALFVEMKAPGKVERQRQLFVQARLRRSGFKVFSSVDSVEKVDTVVRIARWLVGQEGGAQ